jgi:magnesium transporter
MKTLTIISVVALPMTLVTSFFGMNFDDLPGIHSHHSFWWAMCIMMSTVGGLLMLFWQKKWI